MSCCLEALCTAGSGSKRCPWSLTVCLLLAGGPAAPMRVLQVAWGTVRRLDSAVIVGSPRGAKPHYIGLNSTIPQECKPTRMLDGAGSGAGAGAGTAKSAAQGAAASLIAAVAAAGVALLAL